MANRSGDRNIHIFDSTHPDDPLGGVRLNCSITESNFLDMLDILLVTEGVPFIVQHRTSGHAVTRTHDCLVIGVYDIYCPGIVFSFVGGTQLTR